MRAVAAAHAPRDGGRPLLRELVADLERRMEDRLPGPALDAYRALHAEFENLQRDFRNPAGAQHATEEQVERAGERVSHLLGEEPTSNPFSALRYRMRPDGPGNDFSKPYERRTHEETVWGW